MLQIKGPRAFARQEARYRQLAGFVRYFYDERGATREQVHGMVDQMMDVVDNVRLYTDLDGKPLEQQPKLPI
jgi:hypothetical protein